MNCSSGEVWEPRICSQLVKQAGGLGTPKLTADDQSEASPVEGMPLTCKVCPNSGSDLNRQITKYGFIFIINDILFKIMFSSSVQK